MYSFLFKTVTGFLLPVFLVVSMFLFYRGHNAPGGGFVGGLLAALAYIMVAFAAGHERAENLFRLNPLHLISAGLSIALLSGLLSLLTGAPFMTGEWISLIIPLMGELSLGTPLLFDLGVFLTVIGVTVLIVFTLMGED
jgi:multicomponent Na+:H+ antiporter subunit B